MPPTTSLAIPHQQPPCTKYLTSKHLTRSSLTYLKNVQFAAKTGNRKRSCIDNGGLSYKETFHEVQLQSTIIEPSLLDLLCLSVPYSIEAAA
jgi:hypothetical protein